MQDAVERDCYGRMFPSVATVIPEETVTGKVFAYRRSHTGVMPAACTTSANHEAWRECLACPGFDGCYRLSLGALLVELALRT